MIYVCDTIGRVLTARAQLAHMAWIHKKRHAQEEYPFDADREH